MPIFTLGYSPEAIALFFLVYRWQSLLIHSNVRIDFGPLRWIFASPVFHHWHHANHPEAIDKNFAGQLALLDLLFGTLHLPRAERPRRYGIDTPVPQSYFGQLIHPFIRSPTMSAPRQNDVADGGHVEDITAVHGRYIPGGTKIRSAWGRLGSWRKNARMMLKQAANDKTEPR